MSTNSFDLEVNGLASLAKRIEAERDKQAQVEALFPAGFAALTSSKRLSLVSQLYQANPQLRRELLEFVDRDLRRADQARAISPEEMRKNLDENAKLANQAFQRDVERQARAYKQREMRVAERKDSYNGFSSGLMDVISMAGYGGATKTRDPETGKFKAKAAPKPQVPMAPQSGRRKIRLDD